MFVESLRARTREEHAALEKRFLQMIREIHSEVQYAGFLTKLYGYYHALEKIIHPFLIQSDVIDYASRRKSGQLIEDLDQLPVSRDGFEICTQLPGVNSYYSALGVLYVLEGSTLGGNIIAKILSSRLSAPSGLGFFQSYGDSTLAMWNRFKAYLEQPFTQEQQEQIITSALLTFKTFKNWLDTK